MKSKVVLETKADVLKRSNQLLRVWMWSSIIWEIVEYVLAVSSFSASVAVMCVQVANLPPDKATLYTILLTAVSTSMVIANSCINPREQKKRYRRAFDELNAGVFAYLPDGDADCAELAKCITKGEFIIGGFLEAEIMNNYKAPLPPETNR